MEKNTGKVREKSGNFVSPEKWEPCICYGKISEKNVNTFIKVKLFISKTSDSCFQGFDFFQMLLASHR